MDIFNMGLIPERKIKKMIEKDYTMYGTKIFNQETKKIGLLLCTWVNVFADGKVDFATCVDSKGKKYNTPMDNISPVEDAKMLQELKTLSKEALLIKWSNMLQKK